MRVNSFHITYSLPPADPALLRDHHGYDSGGTVGKREGEREGGRGRE